MIAEVQGAEAELLALPNQARSDADLTYGQPHPPRLQHLIGVAVDVVAVDLIVLVEALEKRAHRIVSADLLQADHLGLDRGFPILSAIADLRQVALCPGDPRQKPFLELLAADLFR